MHITPSESYSNQVERQKKEEKKMPVIVCNM